jgi:predicted PurR-regulated permease PerM
MVDRRERSPTITALRITLLVVGVLLGLYFLYTIRSVLVIIAVALLLADGIEPLVNWLERRGLHRALAILTVYLGLVVIFAGILTIVIPPVIEQTQNLINEAPHYFTDLGSWLQELQGRTGWSVELSDLTTRLGQLLDQVPLVASGALRFTIGVISGLFGGLVSLVIAFYWLLERREIESTIILLLPPDSRSTAREIINGVHAKLGSYVRGQLFLGAAVGTLSYIGLASLGIKYALVLALVAAVTELIPMIGPWLGGIPAVLVALAVSPLHALLVIILFVVIQQLENHVLVPKVMQHAVGLSPLTVLLAILVGGSLMGIAGTLLAVPIAAVVEVVLRRTYIDPRLRTVSEPERVEAQAE